MNMLCCGRFRLPLDAPLIMGVLNVTPDSFSDGGQFLAVEGAVAHASRMVEEGAAIIDIGGESTRPGARPVSQEEELARVLPVLRAMRGLPVPISVDTRRAVVMREVLAAGASMINDVDALAGAGALDAVASTGCAVCLMHKQGEPATMQVDPRYADVVGEVAAFLAERLAAAQASGVARERIVVDPGFGFGKTAAHNLELLRKLAQLGALGVPLLVGLSRKSMLGSITGRAVGDRMAASVAAALLAVRHGAKIVRVHDVAATRDALAIWRAVEGA